MLSAPLKELSGSLRFRLTLWYTGVVLLMVIVTLVGIREGLRITVLHEVDQFLRERPGHFGLLNALGIGQFLLAKL